MSKLLDAILDAERLAECTKHDPQPRVGDFIVLADDDSAVLTRTNDLGIAERLKASVLHDFGVRSTLFRAIPH